MSNPIAGLFTWKLHGDGKTLKPGEVVEPDERLTWPRTAEIGAQHVIAMFGATFLVPILTGFDPSTTLFFTAMSTALFLLINKNMLPSYLGSSFGFIAPIAAVASAHKGLAVASFGIMVTGILLALIGVLVHYAGAKWIDIIMPPVVNGAIVAIIGFNLAPSVWNNFQLAPDTALVTLVAVLVISVLFKGLLGRLNILLGVIVGYIYACFRGQVDFSAVNEAAWIGLPKFHLPQVDFSILPMFIPVVHPEHCTGSGLCTKSCPTGTPAIRIADRKAVLGEIGGHYRRGWLPDDDPKNRRGDAPADAPEASAQGAGGLDYLNENAL